MKLKKTVVSGLVRQPSCTAAWLFDSYWYESPVIKYWHDISHVQQQCLSYKYLLYKWVVVKWVFVQTFVTQLVCRTSWAVYKGESLKEFLA